MASEHFFRPAAVICAWIYGVVLLGLLGAGSAAAQTVTYIHTDALGSVVAETDANGNVIKRYDYEPYGAVVGGEVTDGLGYTGHVSDSATGLSYMQQRYMDPQLGVFLSVDPVTAYEQPVGQFNRYRYANNNPYRFTDPDGRTAVCSQRSCAIDCNSGFTCAVDYLYVGTVYGGRLLRNAIESIQRSEKAPPEQGIESQPQPGDAESDEGCIYCVDGAKTGSGKDYIGSSDDMGRRERDSSDGRDRRGAERVDSYKKGDRADRQNKEQQAMNDRGGKDNLDNKRNEVSPSKWEDRTLGPQLSEGSGHE
jgi:RHS repeat-associated protein